jgi:hypothetical protein
VFHFPQIAFEVTRSILGYGSRKKCYLRQKGSEICKLHDWDSCNEKISWSLAYLLADVSKLSPADMSRVDHDPNLLNLLTELVLEASDGDES